MRVEGPSGTSSVWVKVDDEEEEEDAGRPSESESRSEPAKNRESGVGVGGQSADSDGDDMGFDVVLVVQSWRKLVYMYTCVCCESKRQLR